MGDLSSRIPLAKQRWPRDVTPAQVAQYIFQWKLKSHAVRTSVDWYKLVAGGAVEVAQLVVDVLPSEGQAWASEKGEAEGIFGRCEDEWPKVVATQSQGLWSTQTWRIPDPGKGESFWGEWAAHGRL